MTGYLDEFEDIPGTLVFITRRSRQGFNVNQFCMSLRQEANRLSFRADEADYLRGWNLTPAQADAVLRRDWNAMMAEARWRREPPRRRQYTPSAFRAGGAPPLKVAASCRAALTSSVVSTPTATKSAPSSR